MLGAGQPWQANRVNRVRENGQNKAGAKLLWKAGEGTAGTAFSGHTDLTVMVHPSNMKASTDIYMDGHNKYNHAQQNSIMDTNI